MAVGSGPMAWEVLKHGRQTTVEDAIGNTQRILGHNIGVRSIGPISDEDPRIEINDRRQVHSEPKLTQGDCVIGGPATSGSHIIVLGDLSSAWLRADEPVDTLHPSTFLVDCHDHRTEQRLVLHRLDVATDAGIR